MTATLRLQLGNAARFALTDDGDGGASFGVGNVHAELSRSQLGSVDIGSFRSAIWLLGDTNLFPRTGSSQPGPIGTWDLNSMGLSVVDALGASPIPPIVPLATPPALMPPVTVIPPTARSVYDLLQYADYNAADAVEFANRLGLLAVPTQTALYDVLSSNVADWEIYDPIFWSHYLLNCGTVISAYYANQPVLIRSGNHSISHIKTSNNITVTPVTYICRRYRTRLNTSNTTSWNSQIRRHRPSSHAHRQDR